MTRDQKIATARRLHERGLSHAEIAERFGVAKGTVQKWLAPTKQRSVSFMVVPMISRRGPKFTPPCLRCRYPLLKGEANCPRCGRGVNDHPSVQVQWAVRTIKRPASAMSAEIPSKRQ